LPIARGWASVLAGLSNDHVLSARVPACLEESDDAELRIVAEANDAQRHNRGGHSVEPVAHQILPTAYAPEPVVVVPTVPTLAQLQAHLPSGAGWRYEPKLDGFRGLLWRQAGTTPRLLSRNGRDLGPWFPELVQAALKLPPNTLIDGEIVIADGTGRIDFSGLQTRLTVARKDIVRTAVVQPALLVVFDALEVRGVSLLREPLAMRRCQLGQLLREHAHPCLQLMEQRAEIALARNVDPAQCHRRRRGEAARQLVRPWAAAGLGQNQTLSHC
jgi:ATP-dependent DNA ligase